MNITDEMVDRAVVFYTSGISFISTKDAQAWYDRLPDKPMSVGDFSDTKDLHRFAMRAALTVALGDVLPPGTIWIGDSEIRPFKDDTPGDVEVIEDEEFAEGMAYAFHVGLRKGSEDPVAHDLWNLIHESDSAVYDALLYAVRGMRITAIRTNGVHTAPDKIEPLEDVLRRNNWRVSVAHDHASTGEVLQPTFGAMIKDWHLGTYVASGEGPTVDAAIWDAVDNARMAGKE